jgi:hypothetical protein
VVPVSRCTSPHTTPAPTSPSCPRSCLPSGGASRCCGYLLHRLSQLGWRPGHALTVSALLRGSYHLYQGFGGFAGNVVMGLIFGRLYQRWGRAAPLVVAHTLIDGVTFVGYTLLHGHVAWLP